MSATDRVARDIVVGLHGEASRATYDRFGESFRKAIAFDKIQGLLAETVRTTGPLEETRILDHLDEGSASTVHVAAFYARGARRFIVNLDDKGVLVGLRLDTFIDERKKEAGPADAYVGKRAYRVPGAGVWQVGNGGRDAAQNNHVGNKQQWYAYDLVKPGDGDASFVGDGKELEDYPAWGSDVLAPADGVVVTVVDGIPDQALESRDRYFIPGNLVVIDHGEGEVSFLAHFRKGSIVVKPGAKVKQGQKLGKVGNSGNTSEPHIHWHLATDPDMSKAHGLPIRFAPLLVGGTRVDAPAPSRGDRIENVPAR